MRKNVFPFALLVAAFVLPLAAHADTIDDFVLTGNGLDITFSLPASPPGNDSTCPPGPGSCLPGSETAFYLSALVTTNGVTEEEGLAFPTLRFGGGLVIGSDRYLGDEALFTPDAANPTFTPGTFLVSTFAPLTYTLTITPEAPTAITPEPSSVILFTTGVLGFIGFASIRRRSIKP